MSLGQGNHQRTAVWTRQQASKQAPIEMSVWPAICSERGSTTPHADEGFPEWQEMARYDARVLGAGNPLIAGQLQGS